ncbi:MAG: hypothetical protein Q9M91_07280 [Candidatus Dojkabacteria bacterium]|nr:hypothetical protein [Candidatus Dojkabacteria bacterium]MDQ7021590.1 hypothetical protein [Candidatus Dojkabacteria bacterium]
MSAFSVDFLQNFKLCYNSQHYSELVGLLEDNGTSKEGDLETTKDSLYIPAQITLKGGADVLVMLCTHNTQQQNEDILKYLQSFEDLAEFNGTSLNHIKPSTRDVRTHKVDKQLYVSKHRSIGIS